MKAFLCGILLLGAAVAEPRRAAVVNKQWAKEQSEKLHGTPTETLPAPWVRTIYGTVKEIVTPYAIGDVVFATKPPEDPEELTMNPWVSLKKDGTPKTINPKIKNGKVVNGFPDVRTYFQTASTVTYSHEELQAHNMKEGDVHEEVQLAEEDQTYVSLSPIMRCTPDFYFKRGHANMDSSEPFCFPHDHQKFRIGKTYFMTWFSRYFENSEKVRIHYAYIVEGGKNKGFDKSFKKRGLGGFLNADYHKSPTKDIKAQVHDIADDAKLKGAIPGTFYTSEWMDNDMGFFPIEVQEDWLQGKYYKRVMMAIQPDSVPDDEFDLLESDHLYATFQITESIGKNTKEMRKIKDQTGNDDDFYYYLMAIPTIISITAFCAYLFIIINRKTLDLSTIKKPRRSRYGNQGKYDLPISMTSIHKPTGLKTS